MEVARDATRRVDDPALAGVKARLNELLKQRKSPKEAALYLKSVGITVTPNMMKRLQQIGEWQRQNPSYDGDYNVDEIDDMIVPNSIVNRLSAGPVGAYAINAADALTLGTLDNMTENPALTRAGIEGVRQANPKSSLAGTVTGGAMAAGGAEVAAGKILAKKGLERFAPAVGDMLFGAGYGAGSADEGNRLIGAATGGAAARVGGYAGKKIASATGRAVTGSRDAATRFLTERGIPLTIGQIAGRGGIPGKAVKKIEDALESVPFLGAAIQRRRAEGVEGFNRAAFREVLEPIPPATVSAIGEEGVEQAQQAVSGAYGDALSGVRVKADKIFVRDMRRAMGAGARLHPETAEDFARIVQNELAEELASGELTGEGYQALRQIIRQERAAWKGRPRGHQYGQALRQIEGSLESLMRRKAPKAAQGLNQADAAYRRAGVVRDAVSRGKNAETGGVFTPAQLGIAAEANARKFGGTQGTTQRPFFDLQRAGQEILPSRLPNSGTADRAMAAMALPVLPGLAASGAAGMGWMEPEHAAAMIALGIPFTKAGQKAFQALLVSRPDVVRRAGEQILSRKPVGGLFGAGAAVGALPAQ